jgi:hypothetical protein
MGGSSCPRLLRHQERGPLVGGVVRLSGGTVTLQDAVDAFLDHHDLARSTRRVYRASLADLVAADPADLSHPPPAVARPPT